jgi:hypothetical protein
VSAPALDDDLGFSQRVEDFVVEKLVTNLRIKAFDHHIDLPQLRRVNRQRNAGGNLVLDREVGHDNRLANEDWNECKSPLEIGETLDQGAPVQSKARAGQDGDYV